MIADTVKSHHHPHKVVMTMAMTVQEWMKRLWSFLVNLVANFIADVLEHPRVQEATSKVIVTGVNDALDQPDFPTKIKVISLIAS
jgi:hypothetical protein